MRLSDFGAEETTESLFGLGEEMDYSQGLPTPMGYFGQETPAAPAAGNASFVWAGIIAGVFQSAISYAIMSNAGKWKNPAKVLGYIGGGVMAVSALGSFLAVAAGKQYFDSIRNAGTPKT